MTFGSAESGGPEIYVMELASGVRRIASTAGGLEPFWSPDGESIYYSWYPSMFAVDVAKTPQLELGTPRQMSVFADFAFFGRPSEIHPDGRRILGVTRDPLLGDDSSRSLARIDVIVNWFEELKERAPTRR